MRSIVGIRALLLLVEWRAPQKKEILTKKIMLAVTTLALGSLSFAGSAPAPQVTRQQPAAAAQTAQAAPRSDLATSTCPFTFASGTNNTSLQYCVTAKSNVTQFATPFAREHIAVGTISEGYGICDTHQHRLFRSR